jgi:hypothetical protein
MARFKPTSPISTLPNELLGEILLASAGPEGCSPRSMAQVSSCWYSTILNIPSFWNNINISSARRDWFGRVYHNRCDAKRKICASLIELEQTLSRTKKAPLKIRINCAQWRAEDFKIPWRVQLIQRIFSPEVTPRITFLGIEVNGLQMPEGYIDWSRCNFTSLRTLGCDGTFPSAVPFLRVVDETAGQLQEVDFSWSGPKIVLHNIWSRLKRLCDPGNPKIPIDSVILQCTQLTFLAAAKTDWPTAATPSTEFPNLDWMVSTCSNLAYLANLQLPRLTTLYLTHNVTHGGHDPTTIIRQISGTTIVLPELRVLSMSASTAWLTAFRAPKLKRLIVGTSSSSQEWDDESLVFLCAEKASSPHYIFTSVESFYLTTKASDHRVIDVLQLFPNVSTFGLVSCHSQTAKHFGLKFVETLTLMTSKENALLPKLSTFKWGNFRARLDIEGSHLEEVVRRLFDERMKNDLPLEVVTAYIVHNLEDRSGKEVTFTAETLPDKGIIVHSEDTSNVFYLTE